MVANTRDAVGQVLRINRSRMTPAVARQILTWRVSAAEREHLSELLEKNREGTISPEEHTWLQTCVIMGDLVDYLHAEAESVLHKKRKQRVA